MTSTSATGSRKRRLIASVALTLGVLYLLLLNPAAEMPPPLASDKAPFVWNKDAHWQALEERFQQARIAGCAALEPMINQELARTQQRLDSLSAHSFPPEHQLFTGLEHDIFELAPQVAACPEKLAVYESLQIRVRTLVKAQSQQWDIKSPATRDKVQDELAKGIAEQIGEGFGGHAGVFIRHRHSHARYGGGRGVRNGSE